MIEDWPRHGQNSQRRPESLCLRVSNLPCDPSGNQHVLRDNIVANLQNSALQSVGNFKCLILN